MTNKVVICEGQKDARFLSTVCEDVVGSNEYDTFRNDVADTTETDRIRRHLTDNRTKYLFKSEGGKSELEKIAPKIAVDQCGKSIDLVVVVDLDLTLLSDFIETLNSELRRYHQNSVEIQQTSRNGTQDMICVSCDVNIHSTKEGEFKLVAFVNDHEDAVGIMDGDDKSEQIRKIRQYIENSQESIREFVEFVY